MPPVGNIVFYHFIYPSPMGEKVFPAIVTVSAATTVDLVWFSSADNPAANQKEGVGDTPGTAPLSFWITNS